ncbi:ABC-F family ATP-binding cassette domain-containing protein [Chitinophaga sancti]|uniref:ABC-F family ATP-binding cassette domain-containing protein n=1 Tax=Chitinophaga sancti TaxID=1004 RepID=A0A1K1N8E4_9BACT|nr:ABC-F family ATP-binding cassette domain-containing protein [Chitinophaga sancti]WQD63455.1 ABC-F family ATP-binding cassette domain-containing protein [Chitinophaga sancti]WQG90919.1 ABC-F family ATP-binding cassette domain-containing protein [Chitinophaga sancti]SFW31738.1 ATP-binding cassette, subfamily F, member 3 [Chitinophaga sancti]
MLIALQDITFEFGARAIVENASWHIVPGDRVGLIGMNGTGKSTLLRVINGEYSVSKGSVNKAKNLSLGFFNQDLLSFESDESILKVGMTAFEEAIKLEKDIERLTQELETNQSEALLIEFSDKLHLFETLGGYEMKHRTEQVLEGLGFSTADLERPYNQFSGGWRMRVLLAKLILQQPDVLMLDEPTNHLDLPSIEWLEKYLQSYNGAVIIVSHDRFFLDRMVNKIVELYQQQLHHYSGNYEDYEEEKELRREMQQRSYENQQDYIRQQERFIERFKAKASKAAQAQSAMKRLDRLERVEQVDGGPSKIRINFTVDRTPGKIICTLEDVTKQYGNLSILKNASAIINRGDKIALIGANGKGKSTLLRVIAGTEEMEGERIPGHNVVDSFYAQHQLESLHLDSEILDELKSCGSGRTEVELRSLLGCFLFTGDDVYKKIRILSGGEKARVALAKTIISQANFLLLDEPTNHLDMNSVQMLIDALSKYDGSYVLVSHDRYFVSQTANKIWEIVDGEIKEFKGTYIEWEEHKRRQAEVLKQQAAAEKGQKKETAPVVKQQEPKAPVDKDKKKELQKQQKQFQQLEEQLAKLNAKKADLETEMNKPDVYADKARFQKVETAYAQLSKELKSATEEYEKAFEKLMELEG